MQPKFAGGTPIFCVEDIAYLSPESFVVPMVTGSVAKDLEDFSDGS